MPGIELSSPPKPVGAVMNALLPRLLRSPLHGGASGSLMVLSFVGRKSGRPYSVTVGYRTAGDEMQVFSHTIWRLNFRGGHPATARLRGEDVALVGTLEEDPVAVADASIGYYQEAGSGMRMGLSIPKGRTPTREDFLPVTPPHSFIWLRRA